VTRYANHFIAASLLLLLLMSAQNSILQNVSFILISNSRVIRITSYTQTIE